MTPKWSAKWPTIGSPKMMPIWLYRQYFTKFPLNRHYNFQNAENDCTIALDRDETFDCTADEQLYRDEETRKELKRFSQKRRPSETLVLELLSAMAAPIAESALITGDPDFIYWIIQSLKSSKQKRVATKYRRSGSTNLRYGFIRSKRSLDGLLRGDFNLVAQLEPRVLEDILGHFFKQIYSYEGTSNFAIAKNKKSKRLLTGIETEKPDVNSLWIVEQTSRDKSDECQAQYKLYAANGIENSNIWSKNSHAGPSLRRPFQLFIVPKLSEES
ncbi:hypothetical protein TNCV_786971 [Trichonephila clavipes]|nr:hypothetical protein TNCV_786971 [Trichonephila clavipes]